MGEKVGIAQEDPVEKDNIVQLHQVKHGHEPGEKRPIAEPGTDAVPAQSLRPSAPGPERPMSSPECEPRETVPASGPGWHPEFP